MNQEKHKAVIPRDVQEQPGHALKGHIDMTLVMHMIEDATAPLLDQLPKLKKEIKTQSNTIRDFQTSHKALSRGLADMREALGEFQAVDQRLTQLALQMKVETGRNTEKFDHVDNTLFAAASTLEATRAEMARLERSLATKDDMIRDANTSLDSKADGMQQQFDRLFKALSKESRDTEGRVTELNTKIDRIQHSTATFNAQMSASLTGSIKDIFEQHKVDDAKFAQLALEMFQLKKANRKLETLEQQAKGVAATLESVRGSTNLLSKSLPVLIHMQICEALDSCMGHDYQDEIIQYERAKVKELHGYASVADPGCIQALHLRLMSFLEFMFNKDRGCLTLAFGEDLRPNMMVEELEFINKSDDVGLDKRFEKNKARQASLQEAFELVTRTKHRNARLIDYKLHDLEGCLVDKLRKKVLVHKAVSLKRFDDLDALYGEHAIQGKAQNISSSIENKASGGTSPQKKGLTPAAKSSIQMPKEIYVWRRDKASNYRRFDQKFQALFDNALGDYTHFKTLQIEMFAHNAKMQLEMAMDITQIKQVIGEVQEQFDELESRAEAVQAKTAELDDSQRNIRTSVQEAKDQINECEKQRKQDINSVKTEIESNQSQARGHVEELKNAVSAIEDRILEVQHEAKTIDSRRKLDIADLKLKVQQFELKAQMNKQTTEPGQDQGKKPSDNSRLGKIDFSVIRGHAQNISNEVEEASSGLASERSETFAPILGQGDASSTPQDGNSHVLSNLLRTVTSSPRGSRADQTKEHEESQGLLSQPSATFSACKSSSRQEVKDKSEKPLSLKEKQKKVAQDKLQAQRKREEIAKEKHKERTEREEAKKKEEQERERLQRRKEKEEREQQAAKEEKEAQALRRKEAIAGLKQPAKSVATGQTFLKTLNAIGTAEQQKQEKLDMKLAKLKASVADHAQRVHGKDQSSKRDEPAEQAKKVKIREASAESSDFQSEGGKQAGNQTLAPSKRGAKQFSRLFKATGPMTNQGMSGLSQLSGLGALVGGGQSMTPAQFAKMLRPHLKSFQNELEEGFGGVLIGRIEAVDQQLTTLAQSVAGQTEAILKAQEDQLKQQESKGQQGLKSLEYQLKSLEDQLGQGSGEYHKLRRQTAIEIRQELEKLGGMKGDAEHEFQRINLQLESNQKLVQMLMEDQMINQLLLEQDILDRKQIGLFGTKKNSHIMGVNQGAMANNYSIQKTNSKSRMSPGRESSPSKLNQDNSKGMQFWDLKNKDQSYSQVVKPQEPRDLHHRQQQHEQLTTLSTIHEKSSLLRQSYTSEFSKALNDDKQYNTLFIDKNCASCSGFAPAILKQIKIACLSYVNSPVQFGREQLQFTDLVQVKDMMLKKCEYYSQAIQQANQIKSRYGSLDLRRYMDSQAQSTDSERQSYQLQAGADSRYPSVDHQTVHGDVTANSEDNSEERRPTTQPSTKIGIKRAKVSRAAEETLAEIFNKNKPKFDIGTLTRLVVERKQEQERNTPANDLKSQLFQILDLNGAITAANFASPLSALPRHERIQLKSVKITSNQNMYESARKQATLGNTVATQERAGKARPLQAPKSAVMNRRNEGRKNLTSDDHASQQMMVQGESQNQQMPGLEERYPKRALGHQFSTKISLTPSSANQLSQKSKYRQGKSFDARGNSVSQYPRMVNALSVSNEISNNFISGKSGQPNIIAADQFLTRQGVARAKTPSHATRGATRSGFGAPHGAIFSQPQIPGEEEELIAESYRRTPAGQQRQLQINTGQSTKRNRKADAEGKVTPGSNTLINTPQHATEATATTGLNK